MKRNRITSGSGARGDKRPPIITWNSARLLRRNSLNAFVDMMLNLSNDIETVKINLVGEQSTGKTRLAETLAHLFHKRAKEPFAVRKFGREDLLKFEETVKTLTNMNQVIIFDDVSYLGSTGSTQAITELSQQFTEIRHLEGGQDVKIITIFNSHYTKALTPFLRQANAVMQLSIGQSEVDNVAKSLNLSPGAIKNFQNIQAQATYNKTFSIPYSDTKSFKYSYRKPFAPVLTWTAVKTGILVFPLRKWIDPQCIICADVTDGPVDIVGAAEYAERMKKAHGPQSYRTSLRDLSLITGYDVATKPISRCKKSTVEYLHSPAGKGVTLAHLLKLEGLEYQRTKTPPKED